MRALDSSAAYRYAEAALVKGALANGMFAVAIQRTAWQSHEHGPDLVGSGRQGGAAAPRPRGTLARRLYSLKPELSLRMRAPCIKNSGFR